MPTASAYVPSLVNGLVCAVLQWIALLSRPRSAAADLMANDAVVLVFESSALAYALLLLFALMAAGRRRVSRLAVVAMIAASPVMGPASALFLFFAYVQWSGDVDDGDAAEEDLRLPVFGLAHAMAVLAVALVLAPSACDYTVPCAAVPSRALVRGAVVLLAPLPLLLLRIPASPHLVLAVKVLYLAAYLLVGALGFASHTREADEAKDAAELMQRITERSLETGASRAVLVNFIHLTLGCVMFMAESDSLRGATGPMSVGITFAGPAGSFGFFAGLEKFLELRKAWKGERGLPPRRDKDAE